MLVPAILFEHELRARFLQRILRPDARYFYFQSYCDYDLTVDRSDWKRIQYVSVSPQGELLAYFEARPNRESLIIEDLLIIGLGSLGPTVMATKDVFRFFAYLLQDRGYRKIFFRFVRDNPAARQYERFLLQVARCGSIQGVLTDYVTLTDAKNYDLVIMDIQKQPYLEWFGRQCALHTTA